MFARASRHVNGALTFALLLAVPTQGSSQGLADAARAGEQQRQTSAPARKYTNDDLAASGTDWAITLDGLRHYADVRSELATIRTREPAAYTRLVAASENAHCLEVLSGALDQERAVMRILDRYGVGPHEYLRMEQAVLTATRWAPVRALPSSVSEHPIRLANVRFVRANRRAVHAVTSKYETLERGATLWFDPNRFAEAGGCGVPPRQY